MAKKNLSADRGGKTFSSTSTASSTHADHKNGKATPTAELSEDEKKEKFGKYAISFSHTLLFSFRNYKGEKYNLKKFVDKKAYFIASKSKSGKKIKALERPGLWNGGMAFWNTVFIEVPLFTFNPVKTVNDLLKPAHQKIRE